VQHFGIELALDFILQVQEFLEVDTSPSCDARISTWVRSGQTSTNRINVEQVRPAETCSVIGSQLSRQRRDNLFAVPGELLAEDVPANLVSDAPGEKYQLSIDGLGSVMTSSVDEGSNIGDEGAGDLRCRVLAWVGELN
jgi:hypothetical protein